MIDKYLPIGTVVMLKNGEKRLMITGFVCNDKNSGKTYDYSGCMYPEGILSTEQTFAFNHDQIEHIFFMGYLDEEEKYFKNNLNHFVEQKIDNNNNDNQNINVENNNELSTDLDTL